MKCPRCSAITRTPIARCPGCGFSIEDLDRVLGAPAATGGPLDDDARILSPAEHASLTAALEAAAERTGGAWLIATRASTAPVTPAEYAYWLFNRRGSGSVDGRGLLLLLALREQRIEIEVGSEWEDSANDLETGRVLDREVLPLLGERDYAGALRAALAALTELVMAGRAS